MCWYFLSPHLPSCKSIILLGNFSYQFQTCNHLTPFEKPGLSESDPSNFRPISNLNIIGKILEWLAVSVSLSFSPFQSAYHKFHYQNCSAQTYKRHLGEYRLWQNYYSNCFRYVFSFWYSWPCHTPSQAWHTFGLSGFVISWIRSYLFSHSSFVKIYSLSSPVTTILTGVPQGSVLGPFLLVLFISSIANINNPGQVSHNSVSFHQYVADTQLYNGANSYCLVSQIASIESCTLMVHDWLLNNGLHLNPSKSEAITFFDPRSKPLQTLAESIGSISVAGSPSNIKHQSRIWGSILYQVSEICKASHFHIRALRHIRSSLTTEAVRQ